MKISVQLIAIPILPTKVQTVCQKFPIKETQKTK